jgi:hypothetical protein
MGNLFAELFQETRNRERQLIIRAWHYAQTYSLFGAVPCQLEINRLVRKEQEQDPFGSLQADVYDVARRHKMRIRDDLDDKPCPDCGQYHSQQFQVQWSAMIIKL